MPSENNFQDPNNAKTRHRDFDELTASGLGPNPEDIQELIGLCSSGQMISAERRARELLEIYWDSAVLLNILGSSLAAQNKLADAVLSYQQALRIEPHRSQVHNNLGISFLRLNRLDEAEASLREAIKEDPSNASAHSNLGIVLSGLGKLDEAVASARQAVNIDPSDASSHSNFGNVLVKLGKADEAIGSYREALKIKPDDARFHTYLGNALTSVGKLEEALASYNQALKLNPNAKTYFKLHLLLLNLDNMSSAIQCLETAVKLDPAKIAYKLYLGILLEYAGKITSANIHFEEVRQGSNRNKANLDAWNYIKSAQEKMPKLIASHIKAFQLGMDAAPPSGLVLEFGVRFGNSIRLLAGLAGQEVHGFDSFEGLPEQWHEEAKGSYSTYGVIPELPDNVLIHKGWFDDTLPEFLKTHKEPVRFINIDCDLYSSTKTVLDCLASQIVPGTVIVFDEYIGNAHWREDEFKAFQEAVSTYGWDYEYLAFSLYTKQVVVRIV